MMNWGEGTMGVSIRGIAAAVLLSLAFAFPSSAGLLIAPRSDKFKAGEALTIQAATDTGWFMNGGYPIDSAGFVDLPILKRVHVDGRTQDELETLLAEKLANYIRDPHIKAAPAIRLSLLGNFTRQGLHYVDPKSTLWEAVHTAGGMADERLLPRLHVLRGEKPLEVDVLDAYSKGLTLGAAGIRSGDIIVLPVSRPDEGFWFYFRESLTALSSLATIATAVLTLYITYQVTDF